MTENAKNIIKMLYRSPVIRAAAGVAVITLGASVLLGGCEPTYVDGGRLSFSGTDLDGQPVSLSGERFRGKVVLVELWGTWCPVCISSMPTLKDLHTRFASQGFDVLAVEFAAPDSGPRDEYEASLHEWVRAREIGFTVVHAGEVGGEGEAFPELKSFAGYPTIILIGRDGAVRHVQAGYHYSDAAMLETKIRDLLRERAPQQ